MKSFKFLIFVSFLSLSLIAHASEDSQRRSAFESVVRGLNQSGVLTAPKIARTNSANEVEINVKVVSLSMYEDKIPGTIERETDEWDQHALSFILQEEIPKILPWTPRLDDNAPADSLLNLVGFFRPEAHIQLQIGGGLPSIEQTFLEEYISDQSRQVMDDTLNGKRIRSWPDLETNWAYFHTYDLSSEIIGSALFVIKARGIDEVIVITVLYSHS